MCSVLVSYTTRPSTIRSFIHSFFGSWLLVIRVHHTRLLRFLALRHDTLSSCHVISPRKTKKQQTKVCCFLAPLPPSCFLSFLVPYCITVSRLSHSLYTTRITAGVTPGRHPVIFSSQLLDCCATSRACKQERAFLIGASSRAEPSPAQPSPAATASLLPATLLWAAPARPPALGLLLWATSPQVCVHCSSRLGA